MEQIQTVGFPGINSELADALNRTEEKEEESHDMLLELFLEHACTLGKNQNALGEESRRLTKENERLKLQRIETKKVLEEKETSRIALILKKVNIIYQKAKEHQEKWNEIGNDLAINYEKKCKQFNQAHDFTGEGGVWAIRSMAHGNRSKFLNLENQLKGFDHHFRSSHANLLKEEELKIEGKNEEIIPRIAHELRIDKLNVQLEASSRSTRVFLNFKQKLKDEINYLEMKNETIRGENESLEKEEKRSFESEANVIRGDRLCILNHFTPMIAKASSLYDMVDKQHKEYAEQLKKLHPILNCALDGMFLHSSRIAKETADEIGSLKTQMETFLQEET